MHSQSGASPERHVHSSSRRWAGIVLLLCLGFVPAIPLTAGYEAGHHEAGAPPLPSSWLAAAKQRIAEAEYEISWQDETALADLGAAYHAPNRRHDFRTYFTPEGIRVLPRSEETPSWEWRLSLTGVGRPGAIVPVAPLEHADLRPAGNRIEYERGEVLEWYVNDGKGLEQGFTLRARPGTEDESHEASADRVVIEMALGGSLLAYPTEDGQAIEFRTSGGARTLLYAGLHVADAGGRELPAHMEALAGPEGPVVRIIFEDAIADYPVTVDPLATSPSWTVESDQAGAQFGVSVATAGDVNRDGYSDVIVGAYLYDNGHSNEGRAFVFHGASFGLLTTFAWSAEGNQTSARYGFSVATAGDVNGDGYSDVIVGAYGYDNVQTDEGRAYVYLGSPSGLSAGAAWTAERDQAGAIFGVSVATAGDVNGDGYSDVIVGAQGWDNGQTDEGRAYVYHGSPSGLSTTPSWTKESDRINGNFGVSVATAGDVNGDGYSDVIVGSDRYGSPTGDEGAAFVYHGSVSGLSLSPARALSTGELGGRFGNSVATAGDVNGDGYADVIVGAYHHSGGSTEEGSASVYPGSAAGIVATPLWTQEINAASAQFGVSVGTAGDVNGDGYADIIVGAWLFDGGAGGTDAGRAYVYFGSTAGPGISPGWTTDGTQAGAQYGISVAAAGDVNGDGYADVIVGAALHDNLQVDEGRAYVYLGSASGLRTTASWTAESNQPLSNFGHSVATAGDVNGDGYADVVVGDPYVSFITASDGRASVFLGSGSGLATTPAWSVQSGQAGSGFGGSVATAGDVNGDGYADVIVGAPGYTNDQTDEGRAFLYLGSDTGLQTTPAWTAEGNQANAAFGVRVASAGDVNGDGYGDIIVGAYLYDNGETDEGRAFVYLGSASGLELAPSWTAESQQASSFFGFAVATAGDVNRDGYADIIVGAELYDNDQQNEGRAFLFLGGAGGPLSTPGWTAEGDQTNCAFGRSVASAGDVNMDGYADVIVGAPFSDIDFTNEGHAFVYHGGPSGLQTTPSRSLEGNQADSAFGESVGTAGDVNGDGYADIIVGARAYDNGQTDEGAVFVYHGSFLGTAFFPSWTAESDQIEARYGVSVASAGDVTGDGYADVIVGSPDYENGHIDEGRVFVYHGNGARGLSLEPRPRRESNTGPIAHLGASDHTSSFRLALLGRTPFGRGRVRLEWEVKPLGSVFNGSGTGVGAASADTGVGGAMLSETATGLAEAFPHHWRVRLRYDTPGTPFAQRSRWMTMPWKGWQEAMLRTAAPQGAGRVPDGSTGPPLLVTRSGGNITFTWGASCNTADTDYGVYMGTLGAYDSHISLRCGTDGALTWSYPMPPGNLYFLVVPQSASREGSYGLSSAGIERPVGKDACLPRLLGGCP